MNTYKVSEEWKGEFCDAISSHSIQAENIAEALRRYTKEYFCDETAIVTISRIA